MIGGRQPYWVTETEDDLNGNAFKLTEEDLDDIKAKAKAKVNAQISRDNTDSTVLGSFAPFEASSELLDLPPYSVSLNLEKADKLSQKIDENEKVEVVKQLVKEEQDKFNRLTEDEQEDMIAEKIAQRLQLTVINEEVYNCMLEGVLKWVFETLRFPKFLSDYIASAAAVIIRYIYYGAWAILRGTLWYVIRHWDRLLILAITYFVGEFLAAAQANVIKANLKLELGATDPKIYKELLGEYGGEFVTFIQYLYALGGQKFKGIQSAPDALQWAGDIWINQVFFYTKAIIGFDFAMNLLSSLYQVEPYCKPDTVQHVVATLNRNKSLKTSLTLSKQST